MAEYGNKNLEEEFARMGFDYKSMSERAFYVGDNFALFFDQLNFEYNSIRKSQDTIIFQLGVKCQQKGQPSSIQYLSATCKRYTPDVYEGKEIIETTFYVNEGPFPTKDQLCAEIMDNIKLNEMGHQEANISLKNRIAINKDLENEFARIGFNYNEMLKNAISVSTTRFILLHTKIECDKLNASERIGLSFVVLCKENGQPDSIEHIRASLLRNIPNREKSKAVVDKTYWGFKGPLPTKEQIIAEMIGILKAKDINERFNIAASNSDAQQQTQKTNRRL